MRRQMVDAADLKLMASLAPKQFRCPPDDEHGAISRADMTIDVRLRAGRTPAVVTQLVTHLLLPA